MDELIPFLKTWDIEMTDEFNIVYSIFYCSISISTILFCRQLHNYLHKLIDHIKIKTYYLPKKGSHDILFISRKILTRLFGNEWDSIFHYLVNIELLSKYQ